MSLSSTAIIETITDDVYYALYMFRAFFYYTMYLLKQNEVLFLPCRFTEKYNKLSKVMQPENTGSRIENSCSNLSETSCLNTEHRIPGKPSFLIDLR